jgi:hypothetical protein
MLAGTRWLPELIVELGRFAAERDQAAGRGQRQERVVVKDRERIGRLSPFVMEACKRSAALTDTQRRA